MNLGTADVIRADSRNLPLADNSVDLVVTSPPYFALRSYQDGGEHYAGQIGAEPTPDEFVTSLLEVTAECVRVLKPSGSLWVNLGDKYASKGLLGLPWRYALACASTLGLTIRSETIWAKTDGLPETVRDRPRRTHEHWFQFVTGDCYADLDAVREPYEGAPQRRYAARIKDRRTEGRPAAGWHPVWDEPKSGDNPLGKVPGSVWQVATSKFVAPDHLGVDHFAAFPTEWPKRIILGWSAPGMTVLDPFGGTGTTALAAKALGRHGISVDMSADYCRLAEWRTSDRDQLAAVLGVGKAQGASPTQLTIFDELGDTA